MQPPICCQVFKSRDEATRTPDPYVPNVVRYQLRYIPILLVRLLNRLQSYGIFLKYMQGLGIFLFFMLTIVFPELQELVALANIQGFFRFIFYNIV